MINSLEIPFQELKDFLDCKYEAYNQPTFIDTDPIYIPHRFSLPEDIEISGFLTATIAWGQRKSILKNAVRLMDQMGGKPYEFISEASEEQLRRASDFVHRTFNCDDTFYFFTALKFIYKKHDGLKSIFENSFVKHGDIKMCLVEFRNLFLSFNPAVRTCKHVSDVTRNSSAKRLNMFLRWMVRNDNRGVDFGLWRGIPASALYLPLDVHTGNVSRKLGLLMRNQDDWKAVEEVTANLRILDKSDPVKYDFALFGLGVFEKF